LQKRVSALVPEDALAMRDDRAVALRAVA
jgi:hypothetical protein